MSQTVVVLSGPITVDTQSLRAAGRQVGTARNHLTAAAVKLRLAATELQLIPTPIRCYAARQLLKFAVRIEGVPAPQAQRLSEQLNLSANLYEWTEQKASATHLPYLWAPPGILTTVLIDDLAQELTSWKFSSRLLTTLLQGHINPLLGTVNPRLFNELQVGLHTGGEFPTPSLPLAKYFIGQLGNPHPTDKANAAQPTREGQDQAVARIARGLHNMVAYADRWGGDYPGLRLVISDPHPVKMPTASDLRAHRYVNGEAVVAQFNRDAIKAGMLAPLARTDPVTKGKAILNSRQIRTALQPLPTVVTPRTTSQLLGQIRNLRDHPTHFAAHSLSSGESGKNAGGSSVPTHGEFEIIRHETPGSKRPSWTVIVKGTQEWGIGKPNPKSLEANLAGVGRVQMDEEIAIIAGLEQVGARSGDAVELVGHSQGGIVAASLAANPQITSTYEVASVVTAGSPVSHIQVASTTPMLAFENVGDPVPALDGAFNRTSREHLTVYTTGGEGLATHDLSSYVNAAKTLDASGHGDVVNWMREREAKLGINDETISTPHRFAFTRENAGEHP